MPTQNTQPCPCGSGGDYPACCGRYHQGTHAAPTARALMRARFCAYRRADRDFLAQSWHPRTRPAELNLEAADIQWQRLNILRHTRGEAGDTEGTVEFIAHGRRGAKTEQLHEISRFVFEDGHWYYLDGEILTPSRNGPCPCGSGKKYKRCCGR